MQTNNLIISIENFKAFQKKSALEIAPLTLIYGFNQSGKSTLLRLPTIIADSLYNNNGPIDLDSMALRGSSFSDIGHFSSLTPSIEISKKN